ncbi:MAG: C45 family peptidase [Sphingobacteriia bacterium]|nr:C45 family peptidase [Sphingobacteriia bacterium]
MKMMFRILKWIGGLFLLVLIVILLTSVYLFKTADMKMPSEKVDFNDYPVSDSGQFRVCKGGYIHKNDWGQFEVYIKGDPIHRGVSYGRLTKNLLQYQEDVFVKQIKNFIPSERYFKFMYYLTVIMNRKLGENVPLEYRKEIYGISLSCSNDYNVFGLPYERQLNYHAAHDIGHAMQEYMLVGCTSFAATSQKTKEGGLLIGRNFDFYVGDEFSRNKVLLFVEPDSGFRYFSYTWPGMMGVVSGMNEKGITVTINASKGSMPGFAKTPVSILAREILQYSSSIADAIRIANNYELFVSESILVGSGKEDRAVIIEKSPEKSGLYESKSGFLVCANHYQSDVFRFDSENIENIQQSDSPIRFNRLNELLHDSLNRGLTVEKCISILRDRKGINGVDIGIGNEASINQSIAHHSVVFDPLNLKVWISTSPWQSGQFICYDLNEVFGLSGYEKSIKKAGISSVDSTFVKSEYHRLVEYRKLLRFIHEATKKGQILASNEQYRLLALNPKNYNSWLAVGDYYRSQGKNAEARYYYSGALTRCKSYKRIEDVISHNLIELNE